MERFAGATTTLVIAGLAGSGRVQIGERGPTVEPGHVLWLSAGCAHAYGADAAAPWTIK